MGYEQISFLFRALPNLLVTLALLIALLAVFYKFRWFLAPSALILIGLIICQASLLPRIYWIDRLGQESDTLALRTYKEHLSSLDFDQLEKYYLSCKSPNERAWVGVAMANADRQLARDFFRGRTMRHPHCWTEQSAIYDLVCSQDYFSGAEFSDKAEIITREIAAGQENWRYLAIQMRKSAPSTKPLPSPFDGPDGGEPNPDLWGTHLYFESGKRLEPTTLPPRLTITPE